MCVRKENEPWWAYAFRWVVEQPRSVLAFIGIAAAAMLYMDLRLYIKKQIEAQAETVRVLTEHPSEFRLSSIALKAAERPRPRAADSYFPEGRHGIQGRRGTQITFLSN